MKKLIVVGLMFVLPCFAFGEEIEKIPTTNIEKFMSKKGNMTIKEYYPIGDMSEKGNAVFEALVLSDPSEKIAKTKGLRVEVSEENGRFMRPNAVFIDFEELESLSKAVGYMADLSNKWNQSKKDAYTEVTFSTTGDFKVGFYVKDKKQKMYIHAGVIGKTSLFADADHLEEVKKYIDSAIVLLKSK